MADRYLITGGGSVNWNSTASWSATSGGATGASFPVAGDNVFMDANSGVGNLSVNVASACADFNASGYTGNFGGAGALNVSGNWVFGSGMTITNISSISFISTATGKTITSNGKIFGGGIIFNGVGGGWTLVDALNALGIFTLSNGSFDSASFSISCPNISNTSTTTRSLLLGTSTITLTGTGNIWLTNTAGLTQTVSGISVISTHSGSGSRSFGTGTASTIASLAVTAGNGTFFLTNTMTEGAINFTGFTGDWADTAGTTCTGNITLGAGMTQSGSGTLTLGTTAGIKTFTSNGVALTKAITFSSTAGNGFVLADAMSTAGILTLNSGTLDTASFNVTCLTLINTAANTRVLSLGTSTVTITGTGTFINVLAASLTQTSSNASIVSSYSGAAARTWGGGSGLVYGSLSLTGGNGTFGMGNTSTYGALNFTGYTGTWTDAISPVCTGNLTLGSGMIIGGSGNIQLTAATGTNTVTSNGVVSGKGFIFNGTLTAGHVLADALATISTLAQSSGSLDTNGYTVTAISFTSSGTRGLTLGTTNLVLTGSGTMLNINTTGLTLSAALSTIICNYSGAVARVLGSGTGSIWGNLVVNAGSGTWNINSTNTSFNDVDFTGFTGSYISSASIIIRGDLTYDPVMTVSSTVQVFTFSGISGSGQVFTTNNVVSDRPITVNGTDILTIVGNLSMPTRALVVTSGGLDIGSNTIIALTFQSNNTNTRTLSLGSGTIELTGTGTVWSINAGAVGLTFNVGTSTIKISDIGATIKLMLLGNLSYNTIWFTGNGTGQCRLDAGAVGTVSIKELKIDSVPKSVNFGGNSGLGDKTYNIETFTGFEGTVGNLVTLGAFTLGNRFMLRKKGAIFSSDYLNVHSCIGIEGMKLFAGRHSTNGGFNSGVAFDTPQGASQGNLH